MTEHNLKPFQFKTGHPGGPGRPKGARSRLSECFLDAICADFEKHGVNAIILAREADPAAYVRTIAGLLPKQITGDDGSPIPLRIERVIIDSKN